MKTWGEINQETITKKEKKNSFLDIAMLLQPKERTTDITNVINTCERRLPQRVRTQKELTRSVKCRKITRNFCEYVGHYISAQVAPVDYQKGTIKM